MRAYISTFTVHVIVVGYCLGNDKRAAASQDLIKAHLVRRQNKARHFAVGFQEISSINNKANIQATKRRRRPLVTRQYAFLPARTVARNVNSTRYLLHDSKQDDKTDTDRIHDVSFDSSLLDQSQSKNIPTNQPISISSNRAMKELKGRTQFAGQMEGVKTMAGAFAKFTERLSGRGTRRGVRKAASVTRTASKIKTGKRIQAVKGIKNVGRKGQHIAKPVGVLYTSKMATSLGRRRARKGVVRYSKGRVPSLVAGKQVTKKIGMAAGSRAQTKIARKAGRSVAGRTAAAHRRVLTSAPARRIVLKRLGRGVLIALPAIGGVFAILTFVADCDRIQEEYDKRRSIITLACFLFVGAACADYIDTLCQMLIAHSLFFHEKTNHLLLSESISTGCAVASTLFAVVGEILSHKEAGDDVSAA